MRTSLSASKPERIALSKWSNRRCSTTAGCTSPLPWRISHTYDTFEVIRILAGQILRFAAMAGYPNVTAFCMNELLLLQFSDLSVHKLKVRETCTVANVYVDVALWLAYNFGLRFFDATDTFVAAIHGVSSMPPMLSLPLLMTCDDSDGCDDDTYVVRSFQVKPTRILARHRHQNGVCSHGGLTELLPGPTLANLSQISSVTYVQTVLGRAGYDPENEEVKSGCWVSGGDKHIIGSPLLQSLRPKPFAHLLFPPSLASSTSSRTYTSPIALFKPKTKAPAKKDTSLLRILQPLSLLEALGKSGRPQRYIKRFRYLFNSTEKHIPYSDFINKKLTAQMVLSF
ncbi:hypothetical protein Tco_0480456 [Tanacetum coccineum]